MLYREIYASLEDALEVKQVITVTGMRRVGKTTAVKHLLEKIKSDNKVYFDLERVEIRQIFNQPDYRDIVRSLEAENISFKKKAYIALDEIQLVPNIPSVIKFLYDTYHVKFILTGSSSYYIKNLFSESLAGRKRIFEMFPLSFQEFLRFKNIQANFPEEPELINVAVYNKYKKLYEEFLEFGGFPEVALAEKSKDKIELLKDIINSYLQIDIKFFADFSKVDEIYKIIRLLTSRVGSKVDYSKLAGITGINRKLIKEYLLFFEQTYLIKQIAPYTSNPDREIALQKKLYFTDNGILSVLDKISSGALLENAAAAALSRRGEIKYYARKTGQEIGFILNDSIAFEVKETPAPADLKTLAERAGQIGIKKHFLVGLHFYNPRFKNFVWAGSL